jgi:hypothetical protein
MSTSIEVTNPGERASRGRKNLHEEWLQSPEYKENKRLFLIANPWCEEYLAVGVKVPAILVHHKNKWSYKSKALFCDLFNNGAMALSNKGHFCNHHGLKICPDCKDRVCDAKALRCTVCEAKINPWVKAEIEKGKQERKDRNNAKARSRTAQRVYQTFPCIRRGTEQRCRRKTGLICDYSAKKAKDCPYARLREVTV